MSVLAATTLRERASAKDVPVETVRQGSVKGWASINQTGTQSVAGSFGISGIVDGGVGLTTVGYIAVFTGISNFALSGSSTFNANGADRATTASRRLTVSSSQVSAFDTNTNTLADCGDVSVTATGSLS